MSVDNSKKTLEVFANGVAIIKVAFIPTIPSAYTICLAYNICLDSDNNVIYFNSGDEIYRVELNEGSTSIPSISPSFPLFPLFPPSVLRSFPFPPFFPLSLLSSFTHSHFLSFQLTLKKRMVLNCGRVI